jgi:hypothetical protein
MPRTTNEVVFNREAGAASVKTDNSLRIILDGGDISGTSVVAKSRERSYGLAAARNNRLPLHRL